MNGLGCVHGFDVDSSGVGIARFAGYGDEFFVDGDIEVICKRGNRIRKKYEGKSKKCGVN